MINKKITIGEAAVQSLAEKRFIQACGFDLLRERDRRMMETGAKVRDDGMDGRGLKALVSFYGPEHFFDGAVRIGETVVSCNYFDRIPREAVEGVYFYLLTAGACPSPREEDIMESLYADIWGTSYVEAGLQLLREQHLKRDMAERFPGRQVCLSEEFGPGYFGMSVIETKRFFSILDAAAIGVSVQDSGLMIPQKTCTGLYLVYNRTDLKAEPGCIRCLGSTGGCRFCAIKAKPAESAKSMEEA